MPDNTASEDELNETEGITKEAEKILGGSDQIKKMTAIGSDPEFERLQKEMSEAVEKGDMKKIGEISERIQKYAYALDGTNLRFLQGNGLDFVAKTNRLRNACSLYLLRL